MSLSESNRILKQLLSNDKPFLITRMGMGAETIITYLYYFQSATQTNIQPQMLFTLSNNAGIYNTNDNLKDYVEEYNEAIKNSTYLATFQNSRMSQIQNAYTNKYKLNQVHSRILEPFYCIIEGEKPWSHKLLGKKVLIIHPFIDSMQKQLDNNFQIFMHEKLFSDEQEFIFYKSYQTQAGNTIHTSWKETFELMCNDIERLDFDIALLGCGGYGLPLCNFIYKKMNKSAIYVGGGLQLLFGIMGNRWENIPMWKEIIKKNDTKFIKPSGTEICANKERVENACYW